MARTPIYLIWTLNLEIWSLGIKAGLVHSSRKSTPQPQTLKSYSMESKCTMPGITTSSWHGRHFLSKERSYSTGCEHGSSSPSSLTSWMLLYMSTSLLHKNGPLPSWPLEVFQDGNPPPCITPAHCWLGTWQKVICGSTVWRVNLNFMYLRVCHRINSSEF